MRVGVLALWLVCVSLRGEVGSAQGCGGAPVFAGLAVRVIPDGGTARLPRFRAEVCNVGAASLFAELGDSWANGKALYPTALRLTLTEPNGRRLGLTLRESASSFGTPPVAFTVPLAAGAMYSVPIDLDRYAAVREGGRWDVAVAPGRYRLRVAFTGTGLSREKAEREFPGLHLVPYWVGTVESEPLVFEVRR